MDEFNVDDLDAAIEEDIDKISEQSEQVEEIKEEKKKRGRRKKGEVAEEFEVSDMDLDEFLNKNDLEASDTTGRIIIPTGIQLLDTLCGGGFGTGFVQIAGPAGGGKSAMAGRLLANVRRKWGDDAICIYADAEVSMTEERLAQLGAKNIKIYDSLTVERILAIVDKISAFKEGKPDKLEIPSVIIWDSIANTSTESGDLETDPNKTTGLKARILSHRLPSIVKKLNKYNICLFAVNQFRDKIDMNMYQKAPSPLRFLTGKILPGGNSALYNSFQLLTVTQDEILKDIPDVDVMVKCKFAKNKLFSPNIPFDLAFSFSRGYSNFWTNFMLLKQFKRINTGAWMSLKTIPTETFRQTAAFEKYKSDEKFRTEFDSEVKDVLNVEFVEKYKAVEYSDSDIF
jgi:RecA/RadA recombinase